MPKPAIFLDKDGTLIEDIPYNVDPDRIVFTEGTIAGLKLLHEAGYPLIVISNQSGVARGYFPESALLPVIQKLHAMFDEIGVKLSDFYYCPHHSQGSVSEYAIDCHCRKPKPGMFYQAASDHDIDLNHSWFIGDILHDVAAGRAAGCRTILIDNGNETEWELSQNRLPHHIVSNFHEAAQIILAMKTRQPLLHRL
jgi:D-glycero-D-manno-heptose 1,7-bisphosphate phosphatase